LEKLGFIVETNKVKNISTIKDRHGVPVDLRSCHTAIVDGYVIEGHVPGAEIIRLLKQKPDLVGLSVPGMPAGSPGMEMENGAVTPYQVIAFDRSGRMWVVARYPQ
jgi:hypothetical protein